ncbi:MAG: hypothetical protein ACI865_000609 [Flavobacteriaceae bacterium]|jgi:hypothetical protein
MVVVLVLPQYLIVGNLLLQRPEQQLQRPFGNTYVLMVDGYGGNICDFTVSGWSATGILPVELSDFFGIAITRENVISWTTESEQDNDRFDLLRSFDGINFEVIAQIDGAKNLLRSMSTAM